MKQGNKILLLTALGCLSLIGGVLSGCLLWYGIDMNHRTGDDFWFFFFDSALPAIWFTGIIPSFLGAGLLLWASALQKKTNPEFQKSSTLFRLLGFVFLLVTCLGVLIYSFSGHYFFNSFEFGFWSGLQDFLPGLIFFFILPLSLTAGFFISGKFFAIKSGNKIKETTLANTFS